MAAVLGIDWGEKRIGVAVSDESKTIASPLATLRFTGRRQFLEELDRLAEEYSAGVIVVGLPLTMKGEEAVAAQKIRDHIEWFRLHSAYEWVLWEERLTTREAERVLDQTGLSRTKKREVVDRIAAQRILQSYLDCREVRG